MTNGEDFKSWSTVTTEPASQNGAIWVPTETEPAPQNGASLLYFLQRELLEKQDWVVASEMTKYFQSQTGRAPSNKGEALFMVSDEIIPFLKSWGIKKINDLLDGYAPLQAEQDNLLKKHFEFIASKIEFYDHPKRSQEILKEWHKCEYKKYRYFQNLCSAITESVPLFLNNPDYTQKMNLLSAFFNIPLRPGEPAVSLEKIINPQEKNAQLSLPEPEKIAVLEPQKSPTLEQETGIAQAWNGLRSFIETAGKLISEQITKTHPSKPKPKGPSFLVYHLNGLARANIDPRFLLDIEKYFFWNKGILISNPHEGLKMLGDETMAILESWNIPRINELLNEYQSFEKNLILLKEKKYDEDTDEGRALVSMGPKISSRLSDLYTEITKAVHSPSSDPNFAQQRKKVAAFLHIPLNANEAKPMPFYKITNEKNTFGEQETSLRFYKSDYTETLAADKIPMREFIFKTLHLSDLEKIGKCFSYAESDSGETVVLTLDSYALEVLEKSNLPHQEMTNQLIFTGEVNQGLAGPLQYILEPTRTDNELPSPSEEPRRMLSQLSTVLDSILNSPAALTIGAASMVDKLTSSITEMIGSSSALPFNTPPQAPDSNNQTDYYTVLTSTAAILAAAITLRTLWDKRKKVPTQKTTPGAHGTEPPVTFSSHSHTLPLAEPSVASSAERNGPPPTDQENPKPAPGPGHH